MRILGLRERCTLFERRFPAKKLSFSMLRQIYSEYRIKQRVLTKRLFLSNETLQRQKRLRERVFPLVLDIIEKGSGTFLWVDEATYTKS